MPNEVKVYKNIDDEINKLHEEISLNYENNYYRIIRVGKLLNEKKQKVNFLK